MLLSRPPASNARSRLVLQPAFISRSRPLHVEQLSPAAARLLHPPCVSSTSTRAGARRVLPITIIITNVCIEIIMSRPSPQVHRGGAPYPPHQQQGRHPQPHPQQYPPQYANRRLDDGTEGASAQSPLVCSPKLNFLSLSRAHSQLHLPTLPFKPVTPRPPLPLSRRDQLVTLAAHPRLQLPCDAPHPLRVVWAGRSLAGFCGSIQHGGQGKGGVAMG